MKTVTLVTEFYSEPFGKYIVNKVLNVLSTISCIISENLLCDNYLREKYAHKLAWVGKIFAYQPHFTTARQVTIPLPKTPLKRSFQGLSRGERGWMIRGLDDTKFIKNWIFILKL